MQDPAGRGTGLARLRRAVVLPNDACLECGTNMIKKVSRLHHVVNGEKIMVPRVKHRRCPKCGEGVLSLRDAHDLQLRAFDIYREKYGLLSAEEIRFIREQVKMTQAALVRLLRLGSNTLSRWESGRNVQTAAMDTLLRLVRDLPGSLAYLRKRAT